MDLSELKIFNEVTLWKLLADVSAILGQILNSDQNGRKAEFYFWYHLFKAIETEINRRMDAEGEA